MAKSPFLIDRNNSKLLIIDIQEKLMPAIPMADQIVRQCSVLVQAAGRFGIPVAVSEQYPRGLGKTIDALDRHLPDDVERFEKTSFSIRPFIDQWRDSTSLSRQQVIVCGVESHVCVAQSSLDLISAGLEVFIVVDAIGSRDPRNTDLAVKRLGEAGAVEVSYESVLFEWCEDSRNEHFKEISQWIK